MNQEQQNNTFLLLDSADAPLANGVLESPKDAPEMRVRILDDQIDKVTDHTEIKMLPMAAGEAALLGRIIRSRNDVILVQKVQELERNRRQNLRMPTRFQSFIYPVTGNWYGRQEIRAKDLSCGGIAFYCKKELDAQEWVEVVIPITCEPLIVQCKILRSSKTEQGEIMYAAQFVEMCHDQEMVIREAVYSVQVQTRYRSTEA